MYKLGMFCPRFGFPDFDLWTEVEKYVDKNSDSVEFGATIYFGTYVEEKEGRRVRI